MVVPRMFSLSLATRSLPLVGAIVSDLAQARAERDALIESLGLEDLTENDTDPSGSFQRIGRLQNREAELVAELAGLGIRVVDSRRGRVVFPARLEGVAGLLFWRLGQAGIEEWRPILPMTDHGQAPGVFSSSRPASSGRAAGPPPDGEAPAP